MAGNGHGLLSACRFRTDDVIRAELAHCHAMTITCQCAVAQRNFVWVMDASSNRERFSGTRLIETFRPIEVIF
jgi:hypothetical protein